MIRQAMTKGARRIMRSLRERCFGDIYFVIEGRVSGNDAG
jgi:hypothetical protein